MSPGMRRISRNTRAAAPMRVGITSSSRFIMYRYIASAPAAPFRLPVQPDRCQVLIQVMARADLPALDVRPIGDDPVPPQHRKLVRFAVDHVLLELAHQDALFSGIGLVQH